MLNKKTVLKNILTTASTLAITLAANDAMAAGNLFQQIRLGRPLKRVEPAAAKQNASIGALSATLDKMTQHNNQALVVEDNEYEWNTDEDTDSDEEDISDIQTPLAAAAATAAAAPVVDAFTPATRNVDTSNERARIEARRKAIVGNDESDNDDFPPAPELPAHAVTTPEAKASIAAARAAMRNLFIPRATPDIARATPAAEGVVNFDDLPAPDFAAFDAAEQEAATEDAAAIIEALPAPDFAAFDAAEQEAATEDAAAIIEALPAPDFAAFDAADAAAVDLENLPAPDFAAFDAADAADALDELRADEAAAREAAEDELEADEYREAADAEQEFNERQQEAAEDELEADEYREAADAEQEFNERQQQEVAAPAPTAAAAHLADVLAPAEDTAEEVVFVGMDGIDAVVAATTAPTATPTASVVTTPTVAAVAPASDTKIRIEQMMKKIARNNAPAAVNSVLSQISTRLAGLVIPTAQIAPAASNDVGIAAGSSAEKFGVWGQAMGGVANQKARKGSSGFKSNIVGGMIGVDTMINDRTILGLSFGNVINNVKHKDSNTGDKTKSSSLVAAAYGNYQFDNNFFIRGAGAYSNTFVDNKDLRPIAGGRSGVARGKYKINSFGGEVAVGKIFTLANNVLVTPVIGARFAHTGKIAYQETGGVGLDNKVSQKASNSVMAIAGLQLAKSFTNGATTITPEAHANVAYGLGVKAPSGKFINTLAKETISYRGYKPSRFNSTIGFGVTAESGSLEYGVGYDANIAPGYVGHQGTVKLKVKF